MEWKPVRVRLGDLKPWERNPRRIRLAHAKRLLKSWQEFGQAQTIAIGPDGEVYDGHQRLSALLMAYPGTTGVGWSLNPATWPWPCNG